MLLVHLHLLQRRVEIVLLHRRQLPRHETNPLRLQMLLHCVGHLRLLCHRLHLLHRGHLDFCLLAMPWLQELHRVQLAGGRPCLHHHRLLLRHRHHGCCPPP